MAKKITQEQIDGVCGSLNEAAAAIIAARRMAFNLAKEGNASGVYQIRGEFSGLSAQAKDMEGFLACLRDLMKENG